MKLTDNQLPAAQTSGNMVTLKMGISDNEDDQLMILNVLSSTLYTDKVAAVLREYGCNAFDANVEAGKGDVPFEVGLPNKMEPTLRIRDFGFGMTEEQIANTFVKLGRSTKRDSNAFTGMLGIGSKAGFAYGDSFMVTSFNLGKKVIYNAFRDKGAPRLARMHVGPTPEPDGVEIKVPVRFEHFEEFRVKAERIYRYFKVRPRITGAKVEFFDAERLMSGTGWHYTGSGRSVAIMGNVGYDVSSTGMGDYDGHAISLIGLGVELEFEIGELKMTASREGLEYTDTTKAALLDSLSIVQKEISANLTQKIAVATSLWDAKKSYALLFGTLGAGNVRALKDFTDGRVVWRGVPITEGYMNIENKEHDPEVNVLQVSKRSYSRRRYREFRPSCCQASDSTVLVINDLPTKRQSPSREKGFFDDPVNVNVRDMVVFTFQSAAAQARYWKARGLDGAPTILMSSIPAVYTVSTSGGTSVHNAKHSARAFVLDETGTLAHGARSMYWRAVTVDLKKGRGSYVVLDRFFVGNQTEEPVTFQGKITILRSAGLISGPVYGFKHAALPRLGPGWERLEDAVSLTLQASVKIVAQQTADYVAACNHIPLVSIEHVREFPKGTVIRVLLERIIAMRNPKHKAMMAVVLRHKEVKPWVQEVVLPPPSVALDKMTTAVIQKYPLLDLIAELKYLTNVQIKTVADYIRLVESA